jgi:hypothetical protein
MMLKSAGVEVPRLVVFRVHLLVVAVLVLVVVLDLEALGRVLSQVVALDHRSPVVVVHVRMGLSLFLQHQLQVFPGLLAIVASLEVLLFVLELLLLVLEIALSWLSLDGSALQQQRTLIDLGQDPDHLVLVLFFFLLLISFELSDFVGDNGS